MSGAGDHSVLRLRHRLSLRQEEVLRALTEDEHLATWLPTTMEEALAAGAPALRIPGVRGQALRRRGDPPEGWDRVHGDR